MTSKKYTANILGEEREICGWDENDDLLLADGSCYRFETLIEKAHLPLNRKLLAVVSLHWLDYAWVFNGKCSEDWLNEQPVSALFSEQPAKDEPMRFAGSVLWGNLREFGIDSAEREEIGAVAWFQDEGSAVGWDKQILLRSFREITTEASGPAPPDFFVGIAEAAKYAGVTERTIRNWKKREWLTVKQVGKLIRIKRADLDKCRLKQ